MDEPHPPLPTVSSLRAALSRVTRCPDRTAATTDEALASAFTQLATLGPAAVFVTSFAGHSEWERHPLGDELVQVIEGKAELTILGSEAVTLTLEAGELAVVPKGHWHCFRAPDGVSILTVTPPPTDHFRGARPPV